MTTTTDNPTGVSPDLLERARRHLGEGLDEGEVPDGRRLFLEGLQSLGNREIDQAATSFRQACRQSTPPFDILARVARGECERLRGHTGAALRHWQQVADDDQAPPAARYMAWLSIAGAAEAREDERLLDRARTALDDLRDPDQL